MLQRVQTLFLLGVIIILAVVSFSGDFFTYITDEALYKFSADGITVKTLDNKEVMDTISIPLYIVGIALALFALYVMFGYKNLSRQLASSKILWGLYFVLLLGVVSWNFFIASGQVEGEVLSSNFGRNFYLLVIGLPFAHLTMVNIGKDKKKIDSLNRLR